MRIPNAYTNPAEHCAPTTSTKAADGGAHAKGTGATRHEASAGVTVTVSAEARKLEARHQEGIDAAKVAKLKASIQDGSWKIDHAKIAARIAEDGG